MSSCATNDVFYLQEIAYAIIETNGMMSVIKNRNMTS
ncbi:MAG: YetF domain-containing protein [Eubacteriales bacterium]